MFQIGTGQRFKYKQACLDMHPTAVCKLKRSIANLKGYAVKDSETGEYISNYKTSAEGAWEDAYYKLLKKQKNKKEQRDCNS